MSPGAANLCFPLAEDDELADAVDAERREAVGGLAARQLSAERGPWRGCHQPVPDGLGLLVLEGVLLHRIGIDARFGAELIGTGDLLRSPWQEEESSPLTVDEDWQVLEPARLAVLDERFTRQIAGFPRVGARLFTRAIQRTRQLAINMAIVHHARVDVRVHLLLWHLAGRWGRVRADGVVLPLRLTHAILADLVAAQRPTVSSAVSELGRAGLVHSVAEGWLLTGRPPGETGAGAHAKPAAAG